MIAMSGYGSAEEALSQIDNDIEAAAQRAQQATAWRHQVETMRGEGSSRDGSVSVTVDMTGLLTGLSISDDICQRGGQEVRQGILDALRQAQQDVRDQVLASSEETFGSDSSATGRMREEFDQRFGHFEDDIKAADDQRGPRGFDINW